MSLAWVPASREEDLTDSNADLSRAGSEDTHLTVLAAWQDALDAFPAEMLRSLHALKTRIRQFFTSRLG